MLGRTNVSRYVHESIDPWPLPTLQSDSPNYRVIRWTIAPSERYTRQVRSVHPWRFQWTQQMYFLIRDSNATKQSVLLHYPGHVRPTYSGRMITQTPNRM
ncbi:hypothetical protein KP509_08G050700 [Ceratopteris richardii]|uniref:Uncharacterized protein n=1 Tax=Ceratopteris richardii TaxID=49495 RepID=A0A8T2U7X6_CERRI|nr:hypothetical protein KP509_08G050700 [Ceratopteris richardii]